MPKLQIDPTGKIPIIEVSVFHAQMGEFSLALWDENDRNPVVVGKGDNADDIEDRVRLVPTRAELAGLHGHTLSWVVWVKRLGRGRNQQFSFSVRVTQDGTEIGAVEEKGKLDRSLKSFDGDWKIELV